MAMYLLSFYEIGFGWTGAVYHLLILSLWDLGKWLASVSLMPLYVKTKMDLRAPEGLRHRKARSGVALVTLKVSISFHVASQVPWMSPVSPNPLIIPHGSRMRYGRYVAHGKCCLDRSSQEMTGLVCNTNVKYLLLSGGIWCSDCIVTGLEKREKPEGIKKWKERLSQQRRKTNGKSPKSKANLGDGKQVEVVAWKVYGGGRGTPALKQRMMT